MIVWLEVTPRWPIDASPIRLCSAAERGAQRWNSQIWSAAISDPGTLSISLFNGEIGSEINATGAPVNLSELTLLKMFPEAKSVRWEDAAYRMWAGYYDPSLAPAYDDYAPRPSPFLTIGGERISIGEDLTMASTLVAGRYGLNVRQVSRGKVTRFEKDGNAIKLSLDPAGEAGDTKVLDREYAGTTGAEGSANLKGKLKPWIFGHAKNVEPVLIDEDNSVYQFSGYGPIQSVDYLYERGSSFGVSVGDYASYTALVAATIPAGRWGTCLAEGMIRLGAPQYGVITGDVKGDYAGSVQRRHPGAILQRIATYRSISSDWIDSASLAALDTYAATLPEGGNINLVLTDQEAFGDLARRLAGCFNAQAGFDLMGRLIAPRIAIGDPNFTLDSMGRRLPLATDFVEADTPPPYKRIVMSGDKSWRVHDLSNEIAFYATPTERGIYDDAETYREGDIVSIADGSRWIYINPVPSTGNDPVDASVYWSRLSGAATGPQGDDGIDGEGVAIAFKRSATLPDTPDDTPTWPPTGWYANIDDVPPSDNPLWTVFATRLNTTSDYISQVPTKVEGSDGAPAINPVLAVTVPANKQFTADADGTVKTGQLSFNVAIVATQAGATITGTESVLSVSGCTATAISGGFTIDTVSADSGYVEWKFVAPDGQEAIGRMSFSRQRDPASGGQVSINFSSTSWWGSGSYASSGPGTVLPASSTGKLAIAGYASFFCSGNGEAHLTAKLQYRAVGSGTWIDSGFSSGPSVAVKTPDLPGEPGENTPGDVSPSGTLTGLTPDGSYEVQMVASRDAAYNAISSATGFITLMQVL